MDHLKKLSVPAKKAAHSRSNKRAKAKPLTAATADKLALYEVALQDTAASIAFIQQTVQQKRGHAAWVLREDFCGTGKLCADWVHSQPDRRAVGLDLHGPTLDWGEQRNLLTLPADQRKRVRLYERNVLDGAPNSMERIDVAVAFNSSYCALKQRSDMLHYFRNALRDLRPGGCLLLDYHGGRHILEKRREYTYHPGFAHIWDQGVYDTLSGSMLCHIHFAFPDGSVLKRAFTYDWRLWSLPELRDLMLEAGFASTDVHRAEVDATTLQRRTGFAPVSAAPDADSWTAYLVGWKANP